MAPVGVRAIAGAAEVKLPQNHPEVVLGGTISLDAVGSGDNPLSCHQGARAASRRLTVHLVGNCPGVFTSLDSKQVIDITQSDSPLIGFLQPLSCPPLPHT